MSGKFQIYSGDGKGKTTAALGLIIRYLGRGGKVTFIQFDKSADDEGLLHAERIILRQQSNLTLHATGVRRYDPEAQTFRFENTEADFAEAKRGLKLAVEAVKGEGLVVLDEILSLVLTKLGEKKDVLAVVDAWEKAGRPCELVMTGHRTWEEIVAKADLFTQMRKVKHYFDQGLTARPGIEY